MIQLLTCKMLNAVYINNLRSKTHIAKVEKFYTANLLKTTAILKTSQDAPLIHIWGLGRAGTGISLFISLNFLSKFPWKQQKSFLVKTQNADQGKTQTDGKQQTEGKNVACRLKITCEGDCVLAGQLWCLSLLYWLTKLSK